MNWSILMGNLTLAKMFRHLGSMKRHELKHSTEKPLQWKNQRKYSETYCKLWKCKKCFRNLNLNLLICTLMSTRTMWNCSILIARILNTLNIWIKLSGSNYLDQIIWIKLSRSNFISIFWINFLNQFSYHFSYQFTRIIRNSENHSNQEKFENVITKLNQNIQNNQMQFRILWIPRNFSRSKISVIQTRKCINLKITYWNIEVVER